MPGENGVLARDFTADRAIRGVQPQFDDGASRYAQHQETSLRGPAPRPDRQHTQWHSAAAAEAPASRAHASNQSGSHAGGAQPGMSSGTTAQEPLQEEGSGYMSTESDSDTGATEKSKRKPASPAAQPIRDYKGQSRQMITMAFLEEGGYFDVPIQVASARLGLGVTTLKRVCRASNMKRWPFRKRNSLGRLIDRTKQVLDDGTGQDNMQKLAALQVLEKQRQVMRNCQSKDMDEKIKSYRQAIFKLDHAERKRGEAPASKEQSPTVTKLTANSAVQLILPGQELAHYEAQASTSADH